MKVVLGAALQFSLLREINFQFERDRWFPRSGDYYGSIFRYQDRTMFDRASSFLVISEAIVVPFGIDWAIPSPASELNLGIDHRATRGADWGHVIDSIRNDVPAILKLMPMRVFDEISHCSTERYETNEKDRYFSATQYIENLLRNLTEAYNQKVVFVLSEIDFDVLKIISDAVNDQRISLSFPFPDLKSVRYVDEQALPRAIFNFSPIDASSISTLRDDDLIRRYAKRLNDAIEEDKTEDTSRDFVIGIRELYENGQRFRNAAKVIEIFSYFVDMIFPSSGFFLGKVQDKLKSTADSVSLHLIIARVAEINAQQYMARFENYR